MTVVVLRKKNFEALDVDVYLKAAESGKFVSDLRGEAWTENEHEGGERKSWLKNNSSFIE